MLPFLLFFSIFRIIFSFDPACTSCKHFIPNKNGISDLGQCKMFKNVIDNKNGVEVIIHDFAVHCRNNEHMCGKAGHLFEKNDDENFFYEKEIFEQYNELKNRCCGEVNETNEIEELEKEFFEVFQKIKKFNKKRIINSTRDIYKLFNKK
jgi:hypothetical protein